MGKLWNAIYDWWDSFRMDMNLLAIEDRYRKAGHPAPWRAARDEVFIRSQYIECFRDEASAAFLKGKDLAAFKADWIKKNLGSKYAVLDTATLAKVRAVIRDMPANEALYGEALAKHDLEFKDWLREMDAANKKLNGPTGMDERTRRVLRAGA